MNKKRAGCIVVWLLLFGMLTGCTPLKQTGEFAREAGRTVKRAVTSKISDDTKTDVSGKKQEQDTSDGQQTDSDGQQTDLTGQQADEAASTERKTSSAEQISGENYAYQTLDENTKTVYDEILQTLLEQKEKTEVSTTDTAVLEHAYKAVCADYGGLFWVSGYMYTQYTKGGELVSMEKQMLSYLGTDRYLVLGLTCKTLINDVAEINTTLEQAFGDHFVDIRAYLLENGLEKAGITPTEQDKKELEWGEIPSSLRVDQIHGNYLFYQIVGEYVAEQLEQKGYLR